MLIEASYTTCPLKVDGVTYYECIFENPYPEKEIKGIIVRLDREDQYKIYLRRVEFLKNIAS
ncbi:MAG TPA: hypothetical protein VIK89_02985 [Cytophagaceae bacterium]